MRQSAGLGIQEVCELRSGREADSRAAQHVTDADEVSAFARAVGPVCWIAVRLSLNHRRVHEPG